jgi:hypothetical protein
VDRDAARAAARSLQLLPDVGDQRQVPDVDLGGERPPSRVDHDQPLHLQAMDGVPQWGASHPDDLHQLRLRRAVPPGDLEAQEQVEQGLVGEVCLGGGWRCGRHLEHATTRQLIDDRYISSG